MRIIKQLVADIECNIGEAEEKIMTAYALKAKHPAEASWYRDMALSHLTFNGKGHDLVSVEIDTYKTLPEYREHAEYAESMMDVWNDKHSELIAKAARVKAMIDSFK